MPVIFVPDALVLNFPILNNADVVDRNLFVAPFPCQVVAVSEVHGTAGSDGSAVTADIKKCTGTTAITSGTSILSSTFNLKGTALTPQTGTLVNSISTITLATGDRLALDVTGTTTAVADVILTMYLRRV